MSGRRIKYPLLFIVFQISLASCLKKSSLTFVIDDTVSMQPSIDAVKKASIKIMNSILSVSSSQIEEIVVATFNDPDTKLWAKSRNPNKIREALASIHAHTNIHPNPCPEYAMSGVYLGLNNSRPGSSLFVFTDSDAMDKHLESSVIDLCQKMQSTVNFIIIKSFCLKKFGSELDIYFRVAKACSGKVMYLTSAELSQVFNLVDISIQGEMTDIDWFELPKSSDTRKQFTIDEQVEYVLITAAGSSKELKVMRSDGLNVNSKRVIWLQYVKALQLNNPKAGDYIVEIHDHARIIIEIEARTDFTFEHGFSQQRPKTMKETTAQPIGDTNNYLSILVSDPSDAVTIKEVELVNMKDEMITKIPLENIGENVYTTAAFKSPSHTFKVLVHGVVKKSGRNISRFAKVPVEPQPKPKVIPPKVPHVTINEGKELLTKYGKSVVLTCEVAAYPPPSIYWKDGSGKIISKKFSLKLQPYDYVSYMNLNNVTKPEQISCHAENELLSTGESIAIKVQYFDVKSRLPAVTEIKYGTSRTIKCDITSPLPTQTRWYYQNNKSSSKVLLSTSSSYKVSADGRELTVVYMDKDRDGTYSCEVTLKENDKERHSLQTELKVVGLEIPVIEKRGRVLNVFVNTSATITCKIAKGTPKPKVTWQWKPDNSDWNKLTYIGEQYNIPNVALSQAGIYKCIAENSEGSDQFNTRMVVNSAPIIASVKSNYEVKDGVPFVKLPCTATGYPRPTMTWHEGENLIINGGNYSVNEDGLLIKNPRENESINFTCGASNKHGYDFKVFSLAVNHAPKIDKSIKLVKALINTSTTIKCKILNGTPKPTVTWQWRSKSSNWTQLTQIGEEIQLKSVKMSQSGDYKCVAENKEGVDQLETTLIIQAPPVIISDKIKYFGVVGDPYLRVPCNVTGYPPPIVNWRNAEKVISPDLMYSIENGDLIIVNPQETESTFTCEATNEFGKDSKSFAVSVYHVLTDFGEKKYLFKKEGDTISEEDKNFKCPLSYETPESIQWFKDGFRYNLTGPIIRIENYDDSNYTCRITDKYSSRSYTFILDIGMPPTFLNTEKYIEWTASDEQINCEVQAKPDAKVEWYYNGKRIDKENEFIQTHTIDSWGNYTCRVSNVHGLIEKTTTVQSKDCLIKRFEETQNLPLTLNRDFDEGKLTLSFPLYEIEDKTYFIIPSKETVIFSCAGDSDENHFKTFPSTNEIHAVCDHEDKFIINGTIYKTSDFNCYRKVTPTIVNTGEICHIEGIEKLKVGFNVSSFVEVYEVCYDSKSSIIHSVLAKNGVWDTVANTSGYDWYEYPGMSRVYESGLYNCSAKLSTCCYVKRQLLSAKIVPYSSSTQLSTYIENVNAVPEWRSCNKENNVWDEVKNSLSMIIGYAGGKLVSGASYTSKSGIIPKYLWHLLIIDEKMELAVVHVNDPNPVDEDILCKMPCEGEVYEFLQVTLIDKFTFCCNVDEYFEKFSPKPPNGYID